MSFFGGPQASTASSAPKISNNNGSNKKNDVFVGNLSFDTEESHVHSAFQEIGPITHIKLMRDDEGKSRGFAFVEFADPNHALNAIRNMNGVELNGRTMRCNFSNNSHLEGLASRLGLDMTRDNLNGKANTANSNLGGGGGGGGEQASPFASKTIASEERCARCSNKGALSPCPPAS